MKTILDATKRQLQAVANRSGMNCIIFTHRQADPDALCSAGALKLLLQSSLDFSGENIRLIAPQGASVLGKQISSSLGIDFDDKLKDDSILKADLLIIVDTGDPNLLGSYAEIIKKSGGKKILIDHHSSSELQRIWDGMDEKIVMKDSTSTCEIIALGFPAEMISKKISDMLLAGLLFDSQHLGIATKTTLEAALILVKAGSEISASKKLLRHEPDRSEILGRLKAAQRMRFEEAAGRIVARSEISSYHAAVARMLVEIGADVGIAYGETGGEARLSARSTQSFFKETGIDLSTEIKKVADYFELIGGGHSTAASLSGKMEPEILADRLVQGIKSILLQK